MEVLYQVPQSTATIHYDMAAENRMGPEQENAYEHMQTPRHDHGKTDDSSSESKCLSKLLDGKVLAAILVAILLNLSISIAAIVIITQEKVDSGFTAAQIEQLQIEINETDSRLLHEIASLNQTIKENENKLGILKTTLEGTKNASERFNTANQTDDLSNATSEWRDAERDLLNKIETINGTVEENERKLRNLQASVEGVMGSSLRLAGHNISSGRVEIYYNGIWGTICDDDWDTKDGDVICRMRGYIRAKSAKPKAANGAGIGKIWLTNVNCTGQEATIWECDKGEWGVHSCGHNEDASVECI